MYPMNPLIYALLVLLIAAALLLYGAFVIQ
jgi:hypothetical protein